jgi:hypothetical protein
MSKKNTDDLKGFFFIHFGAPTVPPMRISFSFARISAHHSSKEEAKL